MLHLDPVSLARLQFATTALYHFLFVPLTLGLSFLLAIMESTYVMTGREIWRDTARFWGKLFGINFAMGVATGITMEFQFGTNWAYYSHYVGDIFGAPLAIEGLMAFFLESTFVGLYFFGWDRLPKLGHLAVTWLVALGSNLSALWILIANGWMQHPVGAVFNPDTMRMELTSFWGSDFQSGRPGQVRPYCRRRLRHGLDVRRFHLGLLFALGPPPSFRQKIDHCGFGVRTGVRAMCGRARRRERLHRIRKPKNETRRHRGHVEN